MTDQTCPVDHKHGATANCYTSHGCRCRGCRAGRAAATNQWRKQKAYGRWVPPYVAAEPVRQHVAHLRAFGMGCVRIAEVAGVSTNAIQALVFGRKDLPGVPTVKISRDSAEKLLAVKAEISNMRPSALVPARGVQRRLQALAARGWSLTETARLLGIERRNFMFMTSERCMVRTHLEVAALYDRLWDQEPPRETRTQRNTYSRTVAMARRRGWLPPLAWDDIDNDVTPPATERSGELDELAVELACAGERVRLTAEERRAAVRILHGRRWSDQLIASRLHVRDRTVLRIRQELGLSAFPQDELVRAVAA